MFGFFSLLLLYLLSTLPHTGIESENERKKEKKNVLA